MPGELALPSLEIHNFRGLRELKISRLGRANLIVGKNNVGKTTVLESILLYTRSPLIQHFEDAVASRNEASDVRPKSRSRPSEPKFNFLFSGRPRASEVRDPIEIGPIGDRDKTLVVNIAWKPFERDTRGLIVPVEGGPSTATSKEEKLFLTRSIGGAKRSDIYDTSMPFSEDDSTQWAPEQDLTLALGRLYNCAKILPPSPTSFSILGLLWDNIALERQGEEVLAALRLLEPSLRGLNFRFPGLGPGAYSLLDMKDRRPFIKVDAREPFPLLSMGDGIRRIFEIALFLVYCEDGILLIDEVENGLHYAIQADLWRFIFRVATRLNVQVFATTHSSDCVRAFQEAASESEENGVLIHLGRRGDAIVATEFDEDGLEIAVEMGMELRG